MSASIRDELEKIAAAIKDDNPHAALDSLLTLGAQLLTDVHRIAESLEKIAKAS